MRAQTTSSTSVWNSAQVEGDAIGTAITSRSGFRLRRAATATRMLAPVANPSSIKMIVRPRTWRGPVVAIVAFAPTQFLALADRDLIDNGGADTQAAHHSLVEQANPTRGDGPHRQLFVSRHSEFANQEDVERCSQGLGDLKGDRHPSARSATTITSGRWAYPASFVARMRPASARSR